MGFILDNNILFNLWFSSFLPSFPNLSFLQLFTSPTVLLLFSVELASLLPKAGVGVGGSMDSDLGVIVDGPSAEDLGQSLVFTNSHHNGRTATHSYAHATANSYAHAASGGTTYAHAALVQLATHTVHTITLVCTLLTHTSLCDYTDILYLYIQFLF